MPFEWEQTVKQPDHAVVAALKLINLRGNSIKKLNIGMNLLNIVPGIIKPPHATVKKSKKCEEILIF